MREMRKKLLKIKYLLKNCLCSKITQKLLKKSQVGREKVLFTTFFSIHLVFEELNILYVHLSTAACVF